MKKKEIKLLTWAQSECNNIEDDYITLSGVCDVEEFEWSSNLLLNTKAKTKINNKFLKLVPFSLNPTPHYPNYFVLTCDNSEGTFQYYS